jgi:4-hydroxymandelate synthase
MLRLTVIFVALLVLFSVMAGPNQVDLFLTNHGGPGVQHIGLHTSDIVGAVGNLQGRGVRFNEPPYTYYTQVCL